MTSSTLLPEHRCPFSSVPDAPALYFDRNTDLWIVRSYDLIRTILRDHASFSARILSLDSFSISSPLTGATLAPEQSLLGSDPPLHDRYRALIAPWLTRSAILTYAPATEVVLENQLRLLENRRSCDVVEDLCSPVLASTLCQIFGLDLELLPQMTRWLKVAGMTNAGAKPPSLRPLFNQMLDELWLSAQYCAAENRPSLLHTLMQHHASGELNTAQVLDFSNSVIKGAADTTSLLVASALAMLDESPQPMPMSPEAIDRLIRQALRDHCPVQMTLRQSTREVDLGGQSIPAQARLLLLLGVASRDSKAQHLPHLAFGTGPHRCPGSEIATSLAYLLLTTILTRLIDFKLLRSTALRPDRPALCGFERLEIGFDRIAR